METLQDYVKIYYLEHGYNCSETLIHAGNDYYHLGLHEDDMKMMSCFGSGMYVGSTCGALISSVAILGKMIVETRANDKLGDVRPLIQACYRNFKETEGGTTCAELRPLHHSKEQKCLETVLLAAKALEKTVQEAGVSAI